MKKRWGKGEPVNLSDLLRITPVANEILQLSEEMDMTYADVMWIVAQIIDNNDEIDLHHIRHNLDDDDDDLMLDEEWSEAELESLEEEIDQAQYTVSVKVNSQSRFPEVAFKAGINSRDDISYFFDMVLEMLEKLE